IRSLVDCGVASDVETVIVDGQVIMDNRHIPAAPALDVLLARAQRFAEAYWATYPQLSWDGRTAADTFPNAFPWLEGPLSYRLCSPTGGVQPSPAQTIRFGVSWQPGFHSRYVRMPRSRCAPLLVVSMRKRTHWVLPSITCWALPGTPFARPSLRRSSAQNCWR